MTVLYDWRCPVKECEYEVESFHRPICPSHGEFMHKRFSAPAIVWPKEKRGH